MEEFNGMEEIGVIGAGGWGTTLANLLAENGHSVALWVFEEDLCEIMKNKRENTFYLPGVKILPNIEPTNDLTRAAGGKAFVVSVCPSHVVREVMTKAAEYMRPDSIIISASKGIENTTSMTMSQVLSEIIREGLEQRLAVISGPSFAREVSRGLPASVALASKNSEVANRVRTIFSSARFRLYPNNDVIGTELGGALKNVIAIAAGVSDGLGLGDNARAAMITRGLTEMSRLGLKMGASATTFSGLAGLGDLVLTSTSPQSRNRTLGFMLGQGRSLDQLLEEMKMVAEGIKTCQAVMRLAERYRVRMPIVEAVYDILYNEKDPRRALQELIEKGRYE